MRPIGKLVVVGVGLIGGSFAMALRQAQAVEHIVGVGRSRESLETALELGVVDEVSNDWSAALGGAEMVMLAMPVGQTARICEAMAPHLGADTIVTDAGSTKREVVAGLRAHLAPHLARIVPAHPIAGAEQSGVAAATAILFRERKVVVTSLEENEVTAVDRVCWAWRQCGAVVHQMSPEEHDMVFAAVSHLPHVLAYALVHELAERDNAQLLFSYAASGFRDFTRIASSHPEMWRDICGANRLALLAEIDAYMAQLGRLRQLLDSGDGAALEDVFSRARQARNDWIAKYLSN